MDRSFLLCRTWSPATSRRWCAAGAILTLLLTGCATPDKDGLSFAKALKQTIPKHSANYQEAPIVDESSRKVHDPMELKLRYAKWMEEIKNYPEAKQNYNLVLHDRPKDVEAILGLARIDQATNRLNEAEAGFKKALAQSPDSAAAKNSLGQFYVTQERFHEALPLLSDAILASPQNQAYRFQLAAALAKSGDVDAAYPHFKQVVGDVAAHYNIGMILKSQGHYRRAEKELLSALGKDPDLEQAKQALLEVRQLAHASRAPVDAPGVAPQIQAASVPPSPTESAARYQAVGHQRPAALSARQQEQLRNQRALQR